MLRRYHKRNNNKKVKKKSYGDLTVKELKEKLNKKGIEYKNNATKAELIKLLGAD